MPTDYAYERARQAKRRALRSCSRWMQGYENLQSPVPAERIRGILAMNEITLTTFARAMNMSLSACHYLVYGSSRITLADHARNRRSAQLCARRNARALVENAK
ncbi:TPA: hypothetical protein O8T96_000396 [Enterobacter asburiae]|nr:hypothetical protein [Enterobacter asburiae]